MSGFEVDLEELHGAGNAMLGVSDEVASVTASGVLLGRAGYGSAVLTGAADRFALRFTHAVEGLGLEAEDAGDDLRRTAREYEQTDLLAPSHLPTMDAPAGSSRV